jgi:predicted short-subunit dehydrogenase-like oxidoreductase (DUF2520 family)
MNDDAPARHRIVLIGPGSVGTAAARLLADAGHTIAGTGPPDRRSARRSAEFLGAPVVNMESLPECDLVLIGAPVGAIQDLAMRLADVLEPGTIVCHFAGAYGTGLLDPLPEHIDRAAIHPVQTCPDPATAVARLPGSTWGVTCSDDLSGWAFALIERDLRGHPVAVHESVRPLWHAASVITANGIAALLATAESMLATAGIADPVAVLGPLAAGAVANAREGGGGGATLTGPVVRGEEDTVRRHLESIAEIAPGLESAYRAVARSIIGSARRAQRIDAATERVMSAIVEDR